MRSHFQNLVATRNVGDHKELTEPLVYQSHIAGQIAVPVGFPTDLASFAIGNLSLRGKTEEPAVIHDWLYACGVCSRWQADAIFREALASRGVGQVKCWLYWLAVRLGGWKPWKAHKTGKTKAAKFAHKYH